MEVQAKELEILTPKGHSLDAVKFFTEKTTNRTLVISSATGVLQKYYTKYAQFFATKGFLVYTFDYHGIGTTGSQIDDLKKINTTLKNWGSNDQAAVIAFAKKHNPDSHITLVTHSIGGQIIGFNANHPMIDKIIMVASQGGYWKHFDGIHKPKMWLFWYVFIPVLTSIFGYFPSKKMRFFENLPKHLAYEWASWGKKENYMMHFHNQTDYFFNRIKVPILAMSFSQDDFAPKKTVDWLVNQYKNAQVTRIHHSPQNGGKHVKHFGFFKSSFKDPLWNQTLQWILNNTFKNE